MSDHTPVVVVPCANCGTDCDPNRDRCYGRDRVVCVECAERFGHIERPGRHWGIVRPDAPAGAIS